MGKKKLLLLTGGRGSGKSTVASALAKRNNFTILQSYTTRKPRKKNEKGHIFISDEEFDSIPKEEMVAYSEHYTDRYCATKTQLENADIYIIDLDGVKMLRETYKGDKELVIVHLAVPEGERRKRLLERGDSVRAIKKYLEKDKDLDAVMFREHIADLYLSNDNLHETVYAIESNLNN